MTDDSFVVLCVTRADSGKVVAIRDASFIDAVRLANSYAGGNKQYSTSLKWYGDDDAQRLIAGRGKYRFTLEG